MATPAFSLPETTNDHTTHRTAHHAFAFQQVLSAVTHALAHKDQPLRAAARQRVRRDLDMRRAAASSSTSAWAELLLR
jgi:hypothetical protein